MVGEHISQEIRLKNTNKTKNCLIEETNRNELISKKHKKVSTTLNYIELNYIHKDRKRKNNAFIKMCSV